MSLTKASYSMISGAPVNVLDFGADPTGVEDSLAAFEAAIASIPNNAEFAPYSGGNTVFIPQGKYKLSAQLDIERQIILSGVTTPDGNAWTGSILEFPTGTTGIRIYDYRTSPSGTDAGGTTIENLVIRTTRNSPAAEGGYHGIHADTRFTVRNCVVTYFGDCGINIVATAGGSPNGNANNWRIDNVRCAENGYDGLFVDGADVNAGVAIRLDCSSNLRWGIYDSSFLGNTYVGCHTAANTVGSYKTDNLNARNMLLGCYAEGGQLAELVEPTTVIGGILDFNPSYSPYMLYDGKLGRTIVYQGNSLSSPYAVEFASNGPSLLSLLNSGPYPIRLKGTTGSFFLDWANNSTKFFEITNQDATVANGYPRDVYARTGGGGIALRQGFFGGGNLKYVGWGSAAPVSGSYVAGDIVYNESPISGGYVGWVCTVAGTPGTWKTFGLIS